MKKKTLYRSAACALAVAMTAALAGCSETAESESTAETASAETASPETADDSAYDYLANFSYSDGFDENGYLDGVTAADYVTLPDDYDDITIDASLAEVTDQDITDYINQNILSSFATTNQVTDRAAQDGDTVNIDYVGTIDGVAFDGGSDQGYDLELGSGTFIDGFEEQIVGHTPGETFDVNVTFPENYGSADLAGKAAVFSTTLNYISETVTPEVTDAWVQENLSPTMGVTDVASLNAFVKKQLAFNNQYSEVYTQLHDKVSFADELPESAKEYYRNVLLYGIYSYAQKYGTDMTTIATSGFLGTGYSTVDEFIADMDGSINTQVEQTLLLQAIAEKEGLKCDTNTLNTEFVNQYGIKDPSNFTEIYGENYVKCQLLDSIVMQNLIDNVKYE
ncbi:trigger factor [uncultured Subdoligranulum sp.]|uniref:trigger factor n=1 Tax=uncultured Subdoligranulum sp. TaxID=512298 RepID=UPI003208A10F